MNFKTIANVYEANDAVRARLISTVCNLTDEQAGLPTENGKWTLQGVVEHLALVEKGMTAISAKLLSKAEADGKTSNGSVELSETFLDGMSHMLDQKFDAPDVVGPGGLQTITESLSRMVKSRESLNMLRPKFENVNGTVDSFPHPYFGQMNAHDWLALIGVHEARHLTQIEKLLTK